MGIRSVTSVLFLVTCLSVVESSSFCQNITWKHSSQKRYLEEGIEKNVLLYWGSDPARAASALFAVVSRHQLGYQNVYLENGYHNLQLLAAQVPHNESRRYQEVIIALSTAWEPARIPVWMPIGGNSSGLAGPRLEEFGASTIPAHQQLHVFLPDTFRNLPECRQIMHWEFYTNLTALTLCGFVSNISSRMEVAVMYGLDWKNQMRMEMEKRIKASSLHLRLEDLERKSHFQMLQTGNLSFLFLDYDIWLGHPKVKVVQPPPCVPTTIYSTCQEDFDTSVPIRVADSDKLDRYAPQLFQLAYNFNTSLESVRTILELESHGTSIEEAACEWVLTRDPDANAMVGKKEYEILVFYRADDSDVSRYEELVYLLYDEIQNMYKSDYKIGLRHIQTNSSDNNKVKKIIDRYMTFGYNQQLIGAVVGGIKDIDAVLSMIDGFKLPVFLYDAPGVDTNLAKFVWHASGDARHYVFALRYFFKKMNWSRVAVISDHTSCAGSFVKCLSNVSDVLIRNHIVQKKDVKTVLNEILKEDARVIFVNMNYEDAYIVLSEAARLNMNEAARFAWIVRDWRQSNKTLNFNFFTFSFCYRGNNNISSNSTLDTREKINKLWLKQQWPVHAAAFADATLSLAKVFGAIFDKNPDSRDDVHSQQTMQLFAQYIVEHPVTAATQNLTYINHSIVETVVFLDEWEGNQVNRLARWRVNVSTGSVSIEEQWRTAYYDRAVPHDGTTKCIAHAEDPYDTTCYDVVWALLLVLLLSISQIYILVRRFIRRRLEEHKKIIISKELARRKEFTASIPSNYLVNRSALEFKDELGAGRFGCVSLAVLRVPGSGSEYIAAKALREHQDENEILREACILASLNHDHIIRLVGIIIDNEPPLLLMERAFFGDLHQYLEDRRFLAEGADTESGTENISGEAAHVSAEALTRLARQAASALEYLLLRGVIHRDLRASNCLVTATRSLKLADFGLARKTSPVGTDGGAEYACCRRGVFPVLWMAPESLINGIFSAASDIWAFGVLVFELVTLGARPYGTHTTPPHVMQFVAAGGKPSMPQTASIQTLDLVRLCWQHDPEQRPSAAEVVEYLIKHPDALRPALICEYDEVSNVDSGYDESPMTELMRTDREN